jgi:hypothetical protein
LVANPLADTRGADRHVTHAIGRDPMGLLNSRVPRVTQRPSSHSPLPKSSMKDYEQRPSYRPRPGPGPFACGIVRALPGRTRKGPRRRHVRSVQSSRRRASGCRPPRRCSGELLERCVGERPTRAATPTTAPRDSRPTRPEGRTSRRPGSGSRETRSCGDYPRSAKLRYLRREPRIALSVPVLPHTVDQREHVGGLLEYLVVYGTARVTEGGAPELLCYHSFSGMADDSSSADS